MDRSMLGRVDLGRCEASDLWEEDGVDLVEAGVSVSVGEPGSGSTLDLELVCETGEY